MRLPIILLTLLIWTAVPSVLIAQASPLRSRKLLIISVDGLDWRYLRDRDALGLSIPTLRDLMGHGETAQGVVGVWPTITWPSHTSIVTGVRPDQHGVLGNAARGAPFSTSYWSANVLKTGALWDCAAHAGRTTAAITWPVTLDADVTYNLPEVSVRRNGGSMDFETIAAHATSGLVPAIIKAYPSFAQQWVDDRARTQAALYLLTTVRPDLIFLHLVDLDSEQHDQGPFELNANATLERSDELIGALRRALPGDYDLVVTSDHGFERIDTMTNLHALMKKQGLSGDLRQMGGVVATSDPTIALLLRRLSLEGREVGREIPRQELIRFAPALANDVAVFEPPPHVMFGGADDGPAHTAPREKGEHGFWPLRADYRSVYIHWSPAGPHASLGQIDMLSLRDRLAAIAGLDCR